jgi:hypothetical protein
MGFGKVFYKGKELRAIIESVYELFLYPITNLPNNISSLPKMWVALSKKDKESVIVKINKVKKNIKDKNIRDSIEKIYNLKSSPLWIENTTKLRISLSNRNRETIVVEI